MKKSAATQTERRPRAITILRAAVRKVMKESLLRDLPFYVLRNGRVVRLSNRELRAALRPKKRKR